MLKKFKWFNNWCRDRRNKI